MDAFGICKMFTLQTEMTRLISIDFVTIFPSIGTVGGRGDVLNSKNQSYKGRTGLDQVVMFSL